MERIEMAMKFAKLAHKDLDGVTIRACASELGIDPDDWDYGKHVPQLVAKRCFAYLEAFESENNVYF